MVWLFEKLEGSKYCRTAVTTLLLLMLSINLLIATPVFGEDPTSPPPDFNPPDPLSEVSEDPPCGMSLKNIEHEDGRIEVPRGGEDWEAGAPPVDLTNLAKEITFNLQIHYLSEDERYDTEEFPGSTEETDNNDTSETFRVVFEIENPSNWNVTLRMKDDRNETKLMENDMLLYLGGEGSVRGNEMGDLVFFLESGDLVEFSITVRALSSVATGDQIDITAEVGEPLPENICPQPIFMSVRVAEDGETSFTMVAGLIAAFVGLGFALYLYSGITKHDTGGEVVEKITKHIHDGAMTFLNKEYRILVVFSVVVILVLSLAAALTEAMSLWMPVTFIVGAIFSAVAGNVGMRIATAANGRAAVAVKKNISDGLRIAFSSGAVMGLTVVSLGLLGISVFYLIFKDPNILFGFGFGASSIALFARVGGGIYTKSADVGADLVGKVERNIPEDDPRNPAVIADNVGDNVGDVAGMGADLFESYVDSIIAAMILGLVGVGTLSGEKDFGGVAGAAVLLPMVIAGVGIISSIIGILIVNTSSGKKNPHGVLNSGVLTAALLQGVLSLIIIWYWLGFDYFSIWGAMVAGLVAGLVIGFITEYYTSDEFQPTRGVAEASKTGAATNIIAGMALGMFSTIVPVIMVCVALVLAYWLAGLYGIAMAAVGMLSTLGITLATDSYGPVADNAAGIAEMAGLGKKVRERAEKLDSVGNTTAAIGKGFAIGSAALTALALFSTYTQATHLTFGSLSLMEPFVIVGVFIGVLLVFVFSALTMKAVGKAAKEMVEEVRRQFKEIKGILKGKREPDYKKCIAIATGGALKQMIFPSTLAVVTPIVIGLLLGPAALGGLLAGSIVAGFLMAIMMANAGGAWDNAKKYVEAGNLGGKGSNVHKASVVGDTVGDPFKDTSGPSLNILIKLMSIVSLVFAPLFLLVH